MVYSNCRCVRKEKKNNRKTSLIWVLGSGSKISNVIIIQVRRWASGNIKANQGGIYSAAKLSQECNMSNKHRSMLWNSLRFPSYTHLPKPYLSLPSRSVIIPIIVVHGLCRSVGILVFTICVFLFFMIHQPRPLYRDDWFHLSVCLFVQSPDGCDARNLADTRSKRYSGAGCPLTVPREVGLRVVPQKVSTVPRVERLDNRACFANFR